LKRASCQCGEDKKRRRKERDWCWESKEEREFAVEGKVEPLQLMMVRGPS
jgi:hypothetical protein